jgi:hypothetical protein
MKIIFLFCVLLSVLSSGCSSKPKETELTGEIFIATRGRENFKLGAVTVSVIPLIKAEDYIAGKKVADSGKNMTSAWYFSGLPSSIAQTTTNSDGKFVLNLPRGEYALAATASRRVFKDTENYYWLVRVSADKEKQTVILSNVNLTSADSLDSLFKASAPNSPD